MNRRFVWLAAAALAIGGAVLLYRGPGRGVIRGHVGDAAATMLVHAVLGLSWRARPAVRAAATMAIAMAIEVGQTMWRVDGLVGELVVGGTFDGWDFVAYAVGVAIAVGWEACDGSDTATRYAGRARGGAGAGAGGARHSTTTVGSRCDSQVATFAAIGPGHGRRAAAKPTDV